MKIMLWQNDRKNSLTCKMAVKHESVFLKTANKNSSQMNKVNILNFGNK